MPRAAARLPVMFRVAHCQRIAMRYAARFLLPLCQALVSRFQPCRVTPRVRGMVVASSA